MEEFLRALNREEGKWAFGIFHEAKAGADLVGTGKSQCQVRRNSLRRGGRSGKTMAALGVSFSCGP